MLEPGDRIDDAFPEIAAIADDEIRDATRSALAACLANTPWARLTDMPFSPDLDAADFNALKHVRAVTHASMALARSICEMHDLRVDMDLVIAAGLLIDASKWREFQPAPESGVEYSELGLAIPHAMYAAVVAEQAGLPTDVVSAIASHTPSNSWPTRNIVAVIVHHADMAVTDSCRIAAGHHSSFKSVSRF